MSKDKDAKSSTNTTGLVKAVLEFQFILGLHTWKVSFSNTNVLAEYLQGHGVAVMTAKVTSDATMETLSKGRVEHTRMFSLIWEKAQKTTGYISEIVPDSEEMETTKRQKKPSRRLQALSERLLKNLSSLQAIRELGLKYTKMHLTDFLLK